MKALFYLAGILLILSAFSLTGCAMRQTPHDYCMTHLDHYRDYDECYREVVHAERERKAAWKEVFHPSRKRVNCTRDVTDALGSEEIDCQ